jgi:hypothetical protein
MKNIFITCFLWGCFIPVAFSQKGEHIVGSGHFVKKVEYNSDGIRVEKELGNQVKKPSGNEFLPRDYICNVTGKTDEEKLLFGDIFNAPVEFFYFPSFEASMAGPFGFRIAGDSLGKRYVLEVKYISNYKEVIKATEKKPVTGISENLWDSIPFEIKELIWKQMKTQQYKDRFQYFKVETLTFSVKARFAETLYKKMVSFIDNFKVTGVPDYIMDGYSVTFRNVVDDEVWSLRFHEPRGNALKLANLCRQIITDAVSKKLNESMYISVLDGFDF